MKSSQFFAPRRPPSSIVNNATASAVTTSSTTHANAVQTNSGAVTANTLKTALSITGAGVLKYLALRTLDATARTVRIKLTIDGVACLDATSGSISTSGNGIVAVGAATTSWALLDSVIFNSSLLVEITQSLSETDKIATFWNYEVN